MAKDPPRPKRYVPKHQAASAIFAGVTEILITFPLEFAKTQIQLQDAMPPGQRGAQQLLFRGPGHVLQHTMSTKGFLGLYRGIGPWIFFAPARHSSRFLTFEYTSKQLLKGRSTGLGPWESFFAGFVAGSVEAAIVVTPLNTLCVKLIHDYNAPNPRYRGFFHSLIKIPQEEGIQGLFRGTGATVAKGALTHGIRFALYTQVSEAVQRMTGRQRLGAVYTLGIGGFVGGVSVLLSHPIDTVKSNLQSLGASKRYKGMLDCGIQIVRQDGMAGLFKGCGVRFCRVCMEMGLLFTLYEEFGRVLDERGQILSTVGL